MAVTTAQVAELFVATFNRAPLLEGLNYWADPDSDWTIEQVAEAFYNSPEAQAIYSVDTGYERLPMSNQDFVIAIFDNLLDRLPLTAGLEYWTTALDDGSVARDQMMLASINAINSDPTSDDYQLLANKTEVGLYHAENGGADTDFDLDGITIDPATVTDAKAQINAVVEMSSVTYLQPGQEFTIGTSGDDTFVARGNSSLDNADIINGLGGTDTLEVMLDNWETAESPLLTNIEILKVQAQASTATSGENDVEVGANVVEVNIDAGDMLSVQEYWSEDSRADVVIEDVRRDTTDTTIGFRSADPGTVDLGVYFNPNNIVSLDSSDVGGQITIDVADLEQIADDGGSYANAVADFPYETLAFTFDNVVYGITYETSVATDHASLAAMMDTALETAEVLDANNVGTGEIVNLGGILQAYVSGSFNYTDKNGNPRTNIPSIVIDKVDSSSSGTFSVGGSQWLVNGPVPGSTNYATDLTDVPVTNLLTLTQTDIILDDVGRGSKSGDVEVGSMSTGANSGSAGIEQFNIDVDRDSWIDMLQSTNNTLEVVNVENIGSNGSLRIDSLTDVRVFDAATAAGGLASDLTGMTGDINLTANLTSAVVDKYLARQDDAADASADNSDVTYNLVTDDEFSYDLGDGDDTLSLSISSENFQHAGSSSFEDFVLEVNGNAGDDNLTLDIDDGTGTTDWYANQVIVDGLTVNGNAGDDTITTPGTGNVNIDGGAGSDTIYADNTGFDGDWTISFNLFGVQNGGATLDGVADQNNGNAIYAFNSVDLDVQDLESNAANATLSTVNLAVAVSFKGYEVVVDLAETIGSLTNVAVSDLRINQAIKQAVNNDPVLSKLISVEDGQGRTLVVKSLIDGDLSADEAALALTIDLLASTTPLTAAQVTAGVTAYTDLLSTVDDIYQTSVFGQDIAGADLDGADSLATSDNQINGGDDNGANDVIVLGTGANSNDTVVYTGTNTGTNFIVNFDDSEVAAGNSEVQTFTATAAGEEVINGQITITLASGTSVTTNAINNGDTDVQVANAIVAAINADPAMFTEVTASNALGTSAEVTLIYAAADGNVGLATVTENIATDATMTETTTGAAFAPETVAAAEVTNVTFGAGGAIGDTIIFDGVTTTLADTDGSGAVSIDEAAEQFANGAFTNFTVTDYDYSNGTVQLTANVAGADLSGLATIAGANIAAGDFGGTLAAPGLGFAAVGVCSAGTNGTDAAAAVAEGNDVLTFTAADETGTLTVQVDALGDGVMVDIDVALLETDSAISVGTKAAVAIDAALGALWTVTDNANGTVTLAKGAALGTVASTTYVDGAVKSAIDDAVTTIEGIAPGSTGSDMIDFSSYGVVAVYEGAALHEGAAPAADGDLYVLLTESAINDGEYNIELWDSEISNNGATDAADTRVSVIGVADFGVEQAFTADTFII